MKKICNIGVLCVCALTLNAQTLDRSIRPASAPTKQINVKNAQTFTLSNGLKVFLVEDRTTPIVYCSLLLDIYPKLEGNKAGLSAVFDDVFGKVTQSRNKEQLNKDIDLAGAQVRTHRYGVSVSFLKKYEEQALGIFSDILLTPVFMQEEFDLTVKKYQTFLSSLGDDGGLINRRISAALTYGNGYPDGEVLTRQTLDNICLKDLENYYTTYFAPNVSRLVIVGNISLAEAKTVVKKHFGKWKKRDVPVSQYQLPSIPEATKVAYIVKPNAVQSSIDVTYPVFYPVGSPDTEAAQLMNHILGGSGTGRLFTNLRETHSYTYGIYSYLESNEHVGRFSLSSGRGAASVKASATDSAVYQIKYEMDRMINEPISEKELRDAKAYVAGTFSRSLENAETIAGFAVNTDKYHLPKDYYKDYLKRIDAVTVEDVQSAARKYLKPDNAWIVVTGENVHAEQLIPFASDGVIHYYDYDANTVDMPVVKIQVF